MNWIRGWLGYSL
jgi:hypothetical protein